VRRTSHRAGIIKIATLGVAPDDRERRVFEAAAAAHHRTGAPIITHCEDGLGGGAQLELLDGFGVALDRVVLSHTDKHADRGYHRELLAAGVNLEYDQALREAEPTTELVADMLSDGYRSQIMLGTDGARRSLWRTLGGAPGLAWLVTGFADMLEDAGVDEAARRTMLVDNPARFLAFEPHDF
jgi:5-phospho-D-xylono-1,4-lactonase